MASSGERVAVVVIHGMGNQFPMDTLRGFVDSIKPNNATLFSSPNRITDETETRRLSFSTSTYDFYEYYWAHYIDEPGVGEILKWAFNLLFRKKPSPALVKRIWIARIFIFITLLIVAFLGYMGYNLFKEYINGILTATVFGAGFLLALRIIWSLVSNSVIGKINSSLGDVIKYTVPSPKNIAARDDIRKNGLLLIKNLHELKNDNGKFRYRKIIVVSHSLGTVVAYDILTSLFAQYHRKYSNVPGAILQDDLAKLRAMYENPVNANREYQLQQAALYSEYKKLGNEWRVSNFITLGSPLTHAIMILAHSKVDFDRKKSQREFPTSPPHLDKEDDHYAFEATYKNIKGEEAKIMNLHHAAHFAETQWTNIYYYNDWIGGALKDQFGPGILDIEVRAKNKWTATIPMASHTKYWDSKETVSLDKLKEIFNEIHKL